MQHVSPASLGYTTYAAVVITTQAGVRAVVVAEAGALASGIGAGIMNMLESHLPNMAFISFLAPPRWRAWAPGT
ncbi:MAG: hypothetical protein R2729_17510 [Bryobacteraceae bacterium]